MRQMCQDKPWGKAEDPEKKGCIFIQGVHGMTGCQTLRLQPHAASDLGMHQGD